VKRAAGIVVLALVLGGCGGAYTKQDFIKSADAICASAVRATRALRPPASAQPAAYARWLARLLPILKSEDKQILALKRPQANSALLRRYLAALNGSVSEFKELERVFASETETPQDLGQVNKALRSNPVATLAARYGMRSCGNPGATVT
jgi:hypothetical protein